MIEAEAAGEQPRLRRVMGPGLLLLFIIGDILGTGVYALIGDVAAEVGGAAWVPFLLAFVIAAITALSYLELVTKYPQAAGAALYAQKRSTSRSSPSSWRSWSCARASPPPRPHRGFSRPTSSSRLNSIGGQQASLSSRWCSSPRWPR
jgi:hypothetical protein